MMLHLSHLSEELILWSSSLTQFITIGDAFTTGSSIMPQKKNPDPAELIRGRTGKNFGSLQAMLTTMKGLPLSYYKDMQEDKSLVFHSFDTLLGSIVITNELIKNLKPNKERYSVLFSNNNCGFPKNVSKYIRILVKLNPYFIHGGHFVGNISSQVCRICMIGCQG